MWYGGPPGKKPPYLYVNVKFDRGKITETHCPCENSGSWCFHVIAVCLARIFLQDKCVMKPPLSDSLNNLTTYAQLRTFTQYLIAEFSDRRIVESAQNVLDRMMKPEKCDENAIYDTWGAPDPTAGPGKFLLELKVNFTASFLKPLTDEQVFYSKFSRVKFFYCLYATLCQFFL